MFCVIVDHKKILVCGFYFTYLNVKPKIEKNKRMYEQKF